MFHQTFRGITINTIGQRQFKELRHSSLHSRFHLLSLCSTSFVLLLPGSSTALANLSPTPFSTSRTILAMSPTSSTTDLSLWNGSDEEGFKSLNHPGYTLQSDPDTFLGGWHAHRAVWEVQQEEAAAGDDEEEDKTATTTPPKCWIKDEVMDMITRFDYQTLPIGRSPRILVLYGSLRPTSFSRASAYEFARLLDLLGCDVRIYNPQGLPVRDPALEQDPKVQELRALTHWRYVFHTSTSRLR